MFGGKGYFDFTAPVLYDYIIENAETPREQLEFALQLRESENVVEFRNSLQMMDELLNAGRLADFVRVMKTI